MHCRGETKSCEQWEKQTCPFPSVGKANLPLSKCLWDCGLLLTPVSLRSQVKLSVHVFLFSTSSNTSKMTWEVRRDMVVLCQGRLLECSVLTENAH